jgi:hypothetical protein
MQESECNAIRPGAYQVPQTSRFLAGGLPGPVALLFLGDTNGEA